MRLVDDDAGQGDLAPLLSFEAHQRIRGNDDVAGLGFLADRRSPSRGGLSDAAHAQAGRERRGLLRPHAHDRGRSDHEDRATPHLRRAQSRDRGQDLHGLAQAHVVGQDPTQSGG